MTLGPICIIANGQNVLLAFRDVGGAYPNNTIGAIFSTNAGADWTGPADSLPLSGTGIIRDIACSGERFYVSQFDSPYVWYVAAPRNAWSGISFKTGNGTNGGLAAHDTALLVGESDNEGIYRIAE